MSYDSDDSGKLALQSLTLRGIGPYLHGTRLDIRPITILCGKNGSGKSTWLKVLDMLASWPCFPFCSIGGIGADRTSDAYDYTNAYLQDHIFRPNSIVTNDIEQKEFGSPGTIGLHFSSVEPYALAPMSVAPPDLCRELSSAQSFFWRGECAKGIPFRLRICMPTGREDVWGESLELKIGDRSIIGFARESRAVPFTFYCTADLLPPGPANDEIVPVARFEHRLLDEKRSVNLADLPRYDSSSTTVFGTSNEDVHRQPNTMPTIEFDDQPSTEFSFENDRDKCGEFFELYLRSDKCISSDVAVSLVLHCIHRVRQVFDHLMSGYFHIGALRSVEADRNERTPDCSPPTSRYVGFSGETALAVESAFAYHGLVGTTEPYSGSLSQEFTESQIGVSLRRIADAVRDSSISSTLPTCARRFLDLSSETALREVACASNDPHDVADWYASYFTENPDCEDPPFQDQVEAEVYADVNQAVAHLLNELLVRRDLFRVEDWPDPEHFDPQDFRRDWDQIFEQYWQHGFGAQHEIREYAAAIEGHLAGGFPISEVFELLDEGDIAATGAREVLEVFWELRTPPIPFESPFPRTKSWWLTLIRSVIDNPPDNEARYLAGKLRDSLRLILDGPPPGREARALARRGVESLCESDLARLNRLLLEAAFCDDDNPSGRLPGFVVRTQVSYWLDRLLDTVVIPCDVPWDLGREPSSDRWSGSTAPNGVLPQGKSRPVTFFDPLRWSFDRIGGQGPIGRAGPGLQYDLERFSHPCFRRNLNLVSSERLSAGFHQLAPIIVQTSVMKQHELFAIENPEAHLHLSLQLAVTEFLIQQAHSGKVIVIETHSDLVVRRVLRAILEEEIPQSAMAIYFTDVENIEDGYSNASLTRIRINDRGQVANWPNGFMDDEVRESRRLLDSMYRRPDEDDE